MSELFTVEEINLMCIFDTSARDALIGDITNAVSMLEDTELIEIAERVINKLYKMSGAEFDALELYPVYDDFEAQDNYYFDYDYDNNE